ncbi:3-oxoacyl-[acyl-carrier protein] reductase [Breznakia sp. PF5-3]|uniref:3-oxoacyl-[acyl-carrier-protein] reductase n=1 Tax=unclassified Breznakia TaxID=2623764 RepID=UPI0029E34874|nr:3-oxoacyl-[acyl-carrier protein] reductase [Breznakia sp. PM6-1]MDF9835376.1 3-oxoacyl-[acyl-carrier protein] reductase [Breznakia sp. PF5-3]MDF9836975.1 3-oxoacyl-[acyl-carrier protein] reductase [Breznakia sp. PFB2-8]MDF9859611.1 3-oxoacyl-[acyl-carrier protein] reductase [Breznakia sp. PH5-24]
MDNKVALITGASQGIGKEIAIMMAKEGYDIVINYIGDDTNAKEVSELCETYGVKTLCVMADVTDFDAVGKMFEETLSTFGKIDVLVNNSGITKDTLLLRMSEADFDAVIDVNLKGTFNCIKHAAKPMMKQRSGSIISMASVIGLIGNVGQANYAASKAGIIGLTKSVARELAPRGIRANAIAPGFISTKMTDVLDEQVKEAILKQIPLNELGTMEDVANMVCFLASDKSRYVTGQVLKVDGGMVM